MVGTNTYDISFSQEGDIAVLDPKTVESGKLWYVNDCMVARISPEDREKSFYKTINRSKHKDALSNYSGENSISR